PVIGGDSQIPDNAVDLLRPDQLALPVVVVQSQVGAEKKALFIPSHSQSAAPLVRQESIELSFAESRVSSIVPVFDINPFSSESWRHKIVMLADFCFNATLPEIEYSPGLTVTFVTKLHHRCIPAEPENLMPLRKV